MDPTQRQLARVARGGALGLVGAVSAASAGFVLVVVVTNGFAKETAGLLFSATSVFLVLLSIASLGTDAGLGRFMLWFEARGRGGDITTCLQAAALPVFAISVVMASLLLALAGKLAPVLGLGSDTGPIVLRLLAIALPFAAMGNFALSASRSFGRMRPTVFVGQLGRAPSQVLLALIVSWAGGGLIALSGAWAVPFMVACPLAWWPLYRTLRRRIAISSDRGPQQGSRRIIWREFWGFTWARGIAQVSQMVIQRADIILVAALRSPSEAALYTAATRFVVLGQFGVRAVQQVLQPRFTHLLAKGQTTALHEVFRVATSWNMAMAWPVYLVVGSAPGIYMMIFGESYRDTAAATIVVMVFAMLFAVFSGPVDTLLLMAGKSTLSLYNSLTALVINLGFCLIFIPKLGIAGAAIAWAMAVVCRCGLAMIQVKRHLGVTPLSKGALVVSIANVSCYVIPLLVLDATEELTVLSFFAVVAIGSIAYVFFLWLARRPLMLSAFRSLLPRRIQGRCPWRGG